MTKRRVVLLSGGCLAAALLGAGASGVVARIDGSAAALDRPDLLIAFGICVLVYLGGASTEEAGTLPDA